MKYLYDNLNRATWRFENSRLFLFLDYDGTLTPIVGKPQQAKLASGTRAILRQLSGNPKCKVAVISGRSLKDIKKLVRLRDIIYVGNHGFQVDGQNVKLKKPLPTNYKKNLTRLKAALHRKLAIFDGVCFEDKDICFAVHYRLVASENIPDVIRAFSKIAAPYIAQNKIRVTAGKMLCEIRPPVNWHKGKVVKWLLNKSHGKAILPIYIGDDLTDEDAFKAIKNSGLTIIVEKATRSNASYFVRDTKEVIRFLKMILKLIKKS